MPGRAGRYLTAAWATTPEAFGIYQEPSEMVVRAEGPVVAVDLNDGHLAVRRLDEHGNPVGRPERIDVDLSGSSARRDAQVRHAITRLIHQPCATASTPSPWKISTSPTRAPRAGRPWDEGSAAKASADRGRYPDRGVPQPAHRTSQPTRHRPVRGEPRLYQRMGRPALAQAVQERHPTRGSRHRDRQTRPRPQGAATGRCDTHATRDRVGRATDQAAPDSRQATSSRHRPGTRGTKSRPPGRASTRLLGSATVTPAPANNGPPLGTV